MEKIVHQGNIIEVVQKEVERNGIKKTFEYARRSPGVRVIIPKADSILLSKEFRHELQNYGHRLPGGKVFDSLEEYNNALNAGADIVDAAKQAAVREAQEEVGIRIKDLTLFHTSVCGATVVWDLFYFVVTDFEELSQAPEEGEDIEIAWTDTKTVRRMCLDGSISEERSALVLLRYLEGKKS
jgi:8-oxo-dGTP pyrophosphatase MutT (NUDIX family)